MASCVPHHKEKSKKKGRLEEKETYSVKETIRIYTDWANHYLEKGHYKRLITDLQHDITDGVLLADVIEAVTNEKVRDIKSRPRSSAQMVDNIKACLTFLANLGVNTEGLNAKDIKDGNLKAILGLFFSLSRFKQQQKQQQQQQQKAEQLRQQQQSSSAQQGEMLSRLPSAFKSSNKCPTVTHPNTKDHAHTNGDVPSNKKGGSSKSQAAHNNNNNTYTSGSSLPTKGSSLRDSSSTKSISPGNSTSSIPTPGGRAISRAHTPDRNANRLVNSTSTSSTSSCASASAKSPTTGGASLQKSAGAANKNSMLDKFKFFNSKDKKGTLPKSKSTSGSKSDSEKTVHNVVKPNSLAVESAISTPNEDKSPKGSKSAKKSLGRALGAKGSGKEEPKRTSPVGGSGRVSPTLSRKSAASAKSDISDSSRNGQGSPGTGRKGASKIASLIPKNSTISKTSSKTSIQSGSGIPTPGTGIPKPGSGLSKTASRSVSKEDCRRTSLNKDSGKSLLSPPGANRSLNSPKTKDIATGVSAKQASQHNLTQRSSQSSSHHPQHMSSGHSMVQIEKGSSAKSASSQGTQNANSGSHGNSRIATVQIGGKNNPMATKICSDSQTSSPGYHKTHLGVSSKLSGANRENSHSNSPSPKMVSSGGTQTNLSSLQKSSSRSLKPGEERTIKVSSSISSSSSTGSPGLKRKDLQGVYKSTDPRGTGSDHSNLSDSSSPSTSKSTTSSNDSVIFNPSSCDEMTSIESDSNVRMSTKEKSKSKSRDNGGKLETTFDADGRSESVRKQKISSPKETTIDGETEESLDIKPMQPLSGSYLKGLDNPSTPNKYLKPNSNGVAQHYMNSAQNKMNKSSLDPVKVYQNSMRRLASTSSNMYNNDDYSEIDFDMATGYMSDGDILKTTRMDDFSGYMSEGGASMYARRMQQRFREGMQAVRECMQKSSGLIDDDDSFDDSSSISSGEISDTINDISTDENLTNSSLSDAASHSYNNLRHKGNNRDLANGNLLHKSATVQADVTDSSWRKYPDGTVNGNVNMATETNNPWIKQSDLKNANVGVNVGYGSLRRNGGGRTFDRVDDILQSSEQKGSASPWMKQEEGMRPRQTGRNGPATPGNFGFRRPLSNVSIGSNGSTHSSGSRASGHQLHRPNIEIPKDTVKTSGGQESASFNNYENTQPANGFYSQYAKDHLNKTDLPIPYESSTLDRKQRRGPGSLVSSKTQTGLSSSSQEKIDPDAYKSSTLGRRRPDSSLRERLFGSRTSLNNQRKEGDGNMCNSTIISNPHATLSRRDSSSSGKSLPYNVPYMNNFLSPDYVPNRTSGTYNTPDPTNPQNWLRNTQDAIGSVQQPHLSGTESMESISSTTSSIAAQIQQARALSLANAQILASTRGENGSLHRSNSIKSSKSECVYPNGTQGNELNRTGSFSQITSPNGPSSPTPSNSSQSSSSRFTYPMTALGPMYSSTPNPMVRSTSSQSSNLPYGGLMAMSLTKQRDDDLHGSSLSLVSSSSSVYSTAEEKQAAEIRKLRRELESAQEKVSTLTTQLSTNAHVVAAFEQSLSNMTSRLQHLTNTAEQKDPRLNELLVTLEALRLQNSLLRIARSHMHASKESHDSELNELRATIEALKTSGIQHLGDLASLSPGPRRHTSTSSKDSVLNDGPPGRISRQLSSESMSSLNSMSSACSATSQQSSCTDTESGKKKKKGKGSWLRSSFSKAFSKKKNKGSGSVSDVEPDTTSVGSHNSHNSHSSVPNSPLLTGHIPHGMMMNGPSSAIKTSHSHSGMSDDMDTTQDVTILKKQLREKDMKLTDIQLEALTSAHQLDQLRDTMNKMRSEMANLKADNERLQSIVTPGKAQSSSSSDGKRSTDSLNRRISLGEHPPLDLLLNDGSDKEGRRISISVIMGLGVEINRTVENGKPLETLIGSISVSGKTKWDMLDSLVRRIFKEYVLRIDPVTNLGINSESVWRYHIGEIVRTKDAELPELLPCGYLVGDTTTIQISVKGVYQNSVDSLAFETLIPKSIIQRYVSLLLEHRRIILCGPSGTGKTYLAQKLAEHLVIRSGKELSAGAIATFNVDHKSSKDLRQYLSNIADQCDSSSVGELPSVIILDNLHHVGSLGEVFNGFLSCKYQKCPYIIGTMNQATCSTTNLQLHHNFRWVLCANHMEPVKGFLGRYLRRKLVEAEVKTGVRNNDLVKVIDWIPKVWQHLNKFLETHSSSDVTIGPRLFLSCPMDVNGSQVWFTDLWNYSIVPYLLEAVREGIQLYGRRAPWEDPADWVIDSYPWGVEEGSDGPGLLRLRPEDVGYDSQGIMSVSGGPKSSQQPQSDVEGDPLLNMLMRLQEAASYSSPQSQDSDSTSLDSHSSSISSSLSSGIQDFSSGVESTI